MLPQEIPHRKIMSQKNIRVNWAAYSLQMLAVFQWTSKFDKNRVLQSCARLQQDAELPERAMERESCGDFPPVMMLLFEHVPCSA